MDVNVKTEIRDDLSLAPADAEHEVGISQLDGVESICGDFHNCNESTMDDANSAYFDLGLPTPNATPFCFGAESLYQWHDYHHIDGLDGTDDEGEEAASGTRGRRKLVVSDDDESDVDERRFIDDDGLYSSSDEGIDRPQKTCGDSKKSGVASLFDKIETQNSVSPAALLRMIFQHSFKNNTCFSGIVDLARLLNLSLGKKILPETRYLFDQACNSKTEFTLYATCPKCSKCVATFVEGQKTVQCISCRISVDVGNRSGSSFFAILDPSEPARELLETYEDHYDYVMNDRIASDDRIRDMYDTHKYRTFRNNLPPAERKKYASFSFNADGSEPYENSEYSAWPIYLMINELPPQARLDNLIVAGLWIGKSKPVMSVYLDKFVEKMNEVSIRGAEVTIKGERRTIKFYFLVSPVDTMARFYMNGTVIFFGDYGCDWCLQTGETYEKSRRYPYQISRAPKRDVQNHIFFAERALELKCPYFGVNCVPPLINLRHFDIIWGFTTEYMHQSDNGLFKNFTKALLKKLRPAERALADKYYTEIKLPTHLGRLTRSIKSLAKFKCKEWEIFGLYCSLPIWLAVVREKKLLKHWGRMVESVYTGLKDDISYDELNDIDSNFDEFVRDTEKLYSKKECTYTLHQSLHVAQGIYDWGPSWAHSAFGPESENARLLKTFHSEKGMILQMIRYLNLRRFDKMLKHKMDPDGSEIVEAYLSNVVGSRQNRVLKMKAITYLGRPKPIWQSYARKFNVKLETLAYVKCVIKGALFMSSVKENLRTCNYYAQLNDGRFIKILNFLVNLEDKEEFTVCNFLDVRPNCYARTVMEITRFCENENLIKTEEIAKICVQVNVGVNSYITPLPNMLRY